MFFVLRTVNLRAGLGISKQQRQGFPCHYLKYQLFRNPLFYIHGKRYSCHYYFHVPYPISVCISLII